MQSHYKSVMVSSVCNLYVISRRYAAICMQSVIHSSFLLTFKIDRTQDLSLLQIIIEGTGVEKFREAHSSGNGGDSVTLGDRLL